MRDIEKAIKVEKEYLEYRMKNQEPFHLIDAVKECGFETLNEYFDTKRSYLFGQLKYNYVERAMPDGVAEIFKMIDANVPGVLFVDWEDTYVVCADAGIKEFNKQYCEDNNIQFFPLYTGGGTIVGSKGDFSFGVCCPHSIVNKSNFIINGVKDILQKHTTKKISVNGNDICVDGNKICGSTFYKKGDVFMVIMHFSFSNLTELIRNICTTTKISKPISYVDFMTRTEFKEEVAEWLKV